MDDVIGRAAPSFDEVIRPHRHVYDLITVSHELHPTFTSQQHIDWVDEMLQQAQQKGN